jgi:hypothetical protein
MGAVRDFTYSVKQELLETMREIQEQDKGFWLLDSLFDAISDISIPGDIASYQGDIEAYHRAMLDKKNTSAEHLEAIWAKVYEVDNAYSRNFQDLASSINMLKAVFDGLSDALSPHHPGTNGIPALFVSPDELAGYLRPYEDPEHVADRRMQGEIQKLLGEERFSKAKWDAADEEERKRMLQEFHDEVRLIMGTDAAPDIVFAPIEQREGGLVIAGNYSYETRQITINSDLLTADNSYNLFYTVPHENRHAYQHEIAANSGCHIVSDETRTEWVENLRNIIESKNDQQGYLNQPLERDARSFAGQS